MFVMVRERAVWLQCSPCHCPEYSQALKITGLAIIILSLLQNTKTVEVMTANTILESDSFYEKKNHLYDWCYLIKFNRTFI